MENNKTFISAEQIHRTLRDFENIINDLTNASYTNYPSLIKRFMNYANSNTIIKKIIEPLFNLKLDDNKIFHSYSNWKGYIEIPPDINLHIALVLQLFSEFCIKDDASINEFAFNNYSSSNSYDDGIYKMNSELVSPALRELVNHINDFIEDEVEDKDSIELSSIQIFNIENINNESGNVAIGKDIIINSSIDIDKIPDNFLLAILKQGYSYEFFEKIKGDIDTIKTELKKDKPDENLMKKSLEKIKQIGGKVFIEILVKVISKPIITNIATPFL